jgi:hypothetical protein
MLLMKVGIMWMDVRMEKAFCTLPGEGIGGYLK